MIGPLEVTAVGARTPVGLIAETSAAAIRAGLTRLAEYPFILQNGEAMTAARDARLDPALQGPSRLLALLTSVIDEIERKLGPLARLTTGLHAYLSLPQVRPGFAASDAQQVVQGVARHFHGKGVNALVEFAGHGHAGGVLALRQAVQAHARGEELPSFILGVDSYLHPQTLVWLDHQRLLAQPSSPNGFVPGEGAGCLVLSGRRLRKYAGWPCLAVLSGTGIGQEPQLRDSELGSSGEGMTHAVREAAATLAGAQIDTAYIDVNGERYRSEEWGFVVLRTPELWRSLDYEAPSDCWGDVGAAWLPLAAMLAVRSFARSYARGPRAMVMAGSLDGLRGAMVLQDPRLG